MNSKEWRKIPGFENYSISDLGQIRRDTGGCGRCKAGHILKPKRKRDGYLFVHLYREGGVKCMNIHVLVATAFIGPRPSGMDVAHENGIRDDNRAANLRYATRSENNYDKRKHGTDNRGSKNYIAKWTEEDVLVAMKMRDQGFRHREIACMFNISRSTVTMALSGRQWKHLHEHPAV
jgi:hypothetical protein